MNGRESLPEARESNLLTSCLAELDQQGWDIDEYLAARPALPEPVQEMLRAAARIRCAPRPVASAEFRLRSRRRFADLIAAEAAHRTSRRGPSFRLAPILRPIAAVLVVLLVVAVAIGGVQTASASALPGTPFYPAKLAAEQASLLVAFTPELRAKAHLRVATSRLEEAATEARRGNNAAVPRLLQRYEQQVRAAEAAASQIRSTEDHERIAQAVESLQTQQGKIQPLAIAAPTSTLADAGQERPTVSPTPMTSVASVRAATNTPPRRGKPAKPEEASSKAKGKNVGNSARAAQPVPRDHERQLSVTATPAPVPKPTIASARRAEPSEVLLKTLIAQALAGNVADATTAANAYVNALNAERSHGHHAPGWLRHQRARLEQALGKTPSSTSAALQSALNALDASMAAGPSSAQPATAKPGAKPRASSPEHPPHGQSSVQPAATAEGHPGQGDAHRHSGGRGNSHGNGSNNGHGHGDGSNP